MNALTHYRKFVDAWVEADPEFRLQVDEVRRRIARIEQCYDRDGSR